MRVGTMWLLATAGVVALPYVLRAPHAEPDAAGFHPISRYAWCWTSASGSPDNLGYAWAARITPDGPRCFDEDRPRPAGARP